VPFEELSRIAHAALRERVKELTCLYEIAQFSAWPVRQLEEILVGIVEIVRRAWQYPEITSVRIILDAREYTTLDFREGAQRQSADIVVVGVLRGRIEVFYLEPKDELDEGPFLKEERNLLEAVAAQVASLVERREAEEERACLQDQLRHADRLATLGLLAAGVAHELNEPLNNVLGFAQLAKKHPELAEQVRTDIGRIEAAALQARGTIRKLLVFARQSPPQKTEIDLNRVVLEGLQFFEARCANEGVELVTTLRPELPKVAADASQLNQVLVNLMVNALQAMPDGGRLTVKTDLGPGSVLLVVEDTGVGMTDDVAAKLFVPFFTTKDVGQGTGLGLPVAHGIVASHGGTIRVESSPGCGTRFTIRLPLGWQGESRETECDTTQA
jgi:signal transduction histidine kinase